MLLNSRTSRSIAGSVEVADTSAARRKGLLGRDHLDPSHALLIVPCFSVHTMFMRFPIDVIFIDRAGVVVRVARNLGPWRIAGTWRAHAVIELAAGVVKDGDVQPGDRLYLAAQRAPAGAAVSWPIPA